MSEDVHESGVQELEPCPACGSCIREVRRMVLDSSTSGWSVCRHKWHTWRDSDLGPLPVAKPNTGWMKDIDIPKPGSDDLVLTAQDEKMLRRLHIKI